MDKYPRPVQTYHHKSYPRISSLHNFSGHGKTVLVTGGASGIGLAISKAFARAGVARLILIARSSAPLEHAKKDLVATYPSLEVTTFATSITDSAKISQILRSVGQIDVLVLNAAIAHRRDVATQISEDEVRDAFETNVISTFNISKTYLNTPMDPSITKTILNVSAATAHMRGPHRVAYGASKAAAAQILQSFAAQFPNGTSPALHTGSESTRQQKVKIISFHPGSIYTPGVAANIPRNLFPWDEENLPADFSVWLASEDSAFLHGRHVWANWDVDELITLRERCASDGDFLTIGLVQ